MLMDPAADYTDTVTHLRIFYEGDGWALDGADDMGNYSSMIWKYDSHEFAVAAMPEFVQALTDEGYTLNWRGGPKRAEQRPTRPEEEDYCYTCERVTRWDGEFCTGCGRQWGYSLPPEKED